MIKKTSGPQLQVSREQRHESGHGVKRQMPAAAPTLPGTDNPATLLARTPGVRRVPARELELFIVRGFLDPATCAALSAQIDERRRPSEIADGVGIANFRTSQTWLGGETRLWATSIGRLRRFSACCKV